MNVETEQPAVSSRATIIGETPNIYMERSGKGSRRLSEALLRPPEEPLSPEGIVAATAYEADLCDLRLDDTLTLEQLIRKHKAEATQAPKFFADAFLKGQVHIDGLEGQLRQLKSPEAVYGWLADSAASSALDPTTLRELARQSGVYYRTEVKQALLRGERPHDDVLSAMPIVVDPKEALSYAQAGVKAREHLKAERRRLRNAEHGINGAQRAVVDVYSKRINALVAGDVIILENLAEQSELISDKETVVDAYEAMPAMLSRIAESDELRPRLNKRLDFLKNGIGYDSFGRASAVDKSIFEQPQPELIEESEPPVFTPEQREIFRNTLIPSEVIYDLLQGVLADAGMLSTEPESTWSPGRGQRASDGLFQAVHHPSKDTFAVDGVDGVIMSPNNPRTLFELITVSVHEFEHINQAQADLIFGQFLRIGKIKGRRVSMLRETGANVVQRQSEKELFGSSKPVAFAYARAEQVIESGGDVFDATKAFYDEKMDSSYNTGADSTAKEAADRVLRLMLSNGTNSQPLSYAEENIMNKELESASNDVRRRATLITTLDLDDQLRLHRFGLLPQLEGSGIDWAPLIMKRLQPLIEQALRAKDVIEPQQ